MYYIYKTTNNLNGKIYIGYHKSSDIINDNYIGSGKAFIRAVKKHGKKNFIREILFEFDNYNDVLLKESELVNEDFIKRRDNYNLVVGGRGTEHISGHNAGKICIYSPNTMSNLYINETKLDEYISNGWVVGNNMKNRKGIKKNDIIKYIDKCELDSYLSNGWVSYSTTQNKICISHNETSKLKYIDSDDLDFFINNGYSIGNKKAGVNKCSIYINKDKNNKRIQEHDLDSYIKMGWERGFYRIKIKSKRMYNPITDKLKNIPINEICNYESKGWVVGNNYSTNINKIYITKDKKNKRIKEKDLESFLVDGWEKGMYNKKYDKDLKKTK